MNKILFLFDSTYGDSFFRSFAQELCKNGNHILFVNLQTSDLNKLKNKIKDFNPNILFSFNFSKIKNLKSYLPKRKVIFDIDTPENIIDKDFFIKEYNSNKKTCYISIQSDYIDILKHTVPEITDYSRCAYMPLATSFNNIRSIKKRNIFFCSTNWDYNLVETLSLLDKKQLVKYYDALKENYFTKKELYFSDSKNIDSFLLKWNIAGVARVNLLSTISDLGLEIYGDRWDKLFYDFDLIRCLKNKKILNSKECEKYYNESKISVNFSHLQAKKAFSFRVMDIMATDSCLLMEDKEDWHNLFDKYLSKKTIDSVIYKNKYDLREKAKKLLEDDELRSFCVKELNYAIEQNGRWKHRIKHLEDILKISLKNTSTQGSFIEFKIKKNPKEIYDLNIKEANKTNKNIIAKFKLKNRIKIFFYSMCLALAQIPILDLLQKRKRRNKLRQKIDKYWR